MTDYSTLLQDIKDDDLKKEVQSILESCHDQMQIVIGEVLNEANEDGISKADREAIAKEASKRMETFFKGTILVGYIDLRRQVKAVQRELADLRRHQDRQAKQMASQANLEALERELKKTIRILMPGRSGSDRQEEMNKFYSTVDETARNVKKIMAHLGINP